nr:MATE family efflux transporter [Lachnospiraceae bacterium]
MGINDRSAKNRTFRTLLFLALPTMTEYLLSTLMQYVDTAMVGRLGADATAAVSTTTTITWLTGSLCASVAVAVLTMTATAIGAQNEEKVRKISAQALLLSVATGMIIMLLSVGLSPYIPAWMGIDASVHKDASRYFLIISLPMVFRSMSIVLGGSIRATHDTKTPMIINLCANALNVGLNALFIYGLQMGVTGAAVATALSTTVSGIWTLIVFLGKKQLRFERAQLLPDAKILKETAGIGLPVLATSFTSCMGYVIFAGMITGLGKVVFAAHSIAVTAEEFFYIPGYGLRGATQTLIGNSVGERDPKKLKSVCSVSILFTVLMMCVSGILLYFLSSPLMHFFTSSEEAAGIGAGVLKLVAFSEPFFGLQIVLEGICYGIGKTRLPFFINTVSMYAVRLLFTFLFVHIFHFGLTAVWLCMIADNVCKALAMC